MEIGSRYLGDRQCAFTVWAPQLKQVAVHLIAPEDKLIPLQQDEQGYWHGTATAEPGALYFYRLDGEVDRPDPASHSQPQGVHGPSQVVDHQDFTWMDQAWKNVPLQDYIIYELHVGTFTDEGTFDAIIPRIPELIELGINAIELMPIAQFPGERNWGYDGAYLYGVQQSYGGVQGLKRLVNACHQLGMAVILDTVYNHFGPEGSYVGCYGPYFTSKYQTPWGSAINFDDAYSYGVRHFLIQNALFWFREYHIDALRLDATDQICDRGAKHFLQELAEETAAFSQQAGRKFYLTAETDFNDPRWVRPSTAGGYGIDAQWNDDFHHAVQSLIAKDNLSYYQDFGALDHLAKGYTHNFIYTWNFSKNRQRYHGADASDCSPRQFVIFSQNHDQVGNRMLGDRICHIASFEAQKLTAATVMISPSIPLIFMGEEYAETSPFQYFVSHGDPDLVEAVRRGRREEFAAFHAAGETPDPQAEETFQRSKLHWELRHEGEHQKLRLFYQTLIRLRREIPALYHADRQNLEAVVLAAEKVLKLRRWHGESQVLCLLNFNEQPMTVEATLPPGTWKKLLNSADADWQGPGADLPDSFSTEGGSDMNQQFQLMPQSAVIYHTS